MAKICKYKNEEPIRVYLEDRQNKLIELAFNNIENKMPEKAIEIIMQVNNERYILSSKFNRLFIYFIKF